MSMTQELRKAVNAARRDGRSLPEIARAAGLDPGQLWRWFHEERDMRIASGDKLARSLGFDAKLVKRGRKAVQK